MKKKLLFVLTLIFVLSVCLFGLSACGEGGDDLSGDGVKPTPGGTQTQTVTVSFVVDDSVLTTKTITSGSNVADVPTVPEKTGYVGTWSVSDLTNITTDTTVNAVYTAKTYTLTFDYDGADGDNTLGSKTVTYNQEIGELPEPTKTNYNFVKWIDGTTEIEYTSSTVWDIDADGTIIAVWLEKLCFTPNFSGTEYSVSKGTCTDAIVVIPETHKGLPVTSIGDEAFSDYDSLTSIVIPDSVTSIGENAFYGCSSLAIVVIPDSVTVIKSHAFSNSGLISITVGSGVKGIYDGFDTCYKLVEVINKSKLIITVDDLPSINGGIGFNALNVKLKGESDIVNKDGYLFYTYKETNYLLGYVGRETDLTLPDSFNGQNYKIYRYLFENCTTLTSVKIGNGVTSIGMRAFAGCTALSHVTIGSGVTNINWAAFSRCTSLTSIVIPDSVTYIWDDVFYECNRLSNVSMPDSVTYIGRDAFYGCSSLNYNKYDNAYYLGNESNPYVLLVKALSTEITSCKINDNCKIISNHAFSSCTSLTSIVIPDNVIYIGCYAFNCSSLTSATFENPNGWSANSTNLKLTNASQNATYLNSTYNKYYWKRNA